MSSNPFYISLLALFLVGCALGSNTAAPEASQSTGFSYIGTSNLPEGFEAQGHRGARGLLPENTLPSFEAALDLGVTTLELDLHFTEDGELVVWHDPLIEKQNAAYRGRRPQTAGTMTYPTQKPATQNLSKPTPP